eukprot:SAG11_NODE_1253_length_5385_cov_1.942679_9_plen_76_part_00
MANGRDGIAPQQKERQTKKTLAVGVAWVAAAEAAAVAAAGEGAKPRAEVDAAAAVAEVGTVVKTNWREPAARRWD